MSKERNVAKVMIAGAYALTAPIAIPRDLIKCAVKKMSPAQIIKNNVDAIEDLLMDPSKDVTVSLEGIKIGTKTYYC